jgi:uncharacterized protein YcbX
MISISALHVYPVKSCAGISLQRARLATTGFEHDREWVVVREDGRFVTQREQPRLALIAPALDAHAMTLRAPAMEPLSVSYERQGTHARIKVWNDECAAFDSGEAAASWLTRYLGATHRLLHFDLSQPRPSNPSWTGDVRALNQFSDGYPWLMISEASLADLNARLSQPLPMNRFRPNIVIAGTAPYAEDRIREVHCGPVTLRPVKGCTRCVITTTNQETAVREGNEPLQTLRSYRLDRTLKGVVFGQNVIAIRGIGETLATGDVLETHWID